MIVFRWLDPRLAPAMGDRREATLLEPVLHSFRAEMAPIDAVFGFFCATLALLDEHYRGGAGRRPTSSRWPQHAEEDRRLFCLQVKSEARLRSIPVVVVTGLRTTNLYAGPFIERCFEFHDPPLPLPDAFVDKPVEKDAFLSVVKGTLRAMVVGER